MAQKKCPECGKSRFWKLGDGRLKCVRYFWERVRASDKGKRRLLELFVFGVPAHRTRFRSSVSLSTVEKFFRIVRECLVECQEKELQRLRLSGSLEMDETCFGGRKKGGKPGWAADGKHIVFGIYQRNGQVLVFPVPNREKRTLLPMIETHTKHGSMYFTDEYKAYVILRYRGKHIQIHFVSVIAEHDA